VFAAIHALFISDIWFSLQVLLMAGALCGLCLAWTYSLLFKAPSVGSWLTYNLLFLGMFALLGGLSVLIYEPITTIPALLQLDGPPEDLFAKAMPLTVVFTLFAATVLSVCYGRNWRHYAAILLTCTLLVALLGLNISVMGLVAIPRSSLYLVAVVFGLITALTLVYAVVFMVLEWKRLTRERMTRTGQLPDAKSTVKFS
jgi:hypothetical protein